MLLMTNVEQLEKYGWIRDPQSNDEDPIYRKSLDKGIYLTVWKEDSLDERCRMWEAYYSYGIQGVETPDDLIKIAKEFKCIDLSQVKITEITIPLGALLKEDVERIKKILHNRLNAFDAERQRVRVAYGIFPKDITEATILTECMYQIEKYSESLKESILKCNEVTYSAKENS